MNKIKKLNNLFLNNSIIIFITFLILMKPSSIYIFPIVNKIFNILAIVLMLIIIILYFFQKKVSKLQISIILFIACLGISTIGKVNNYYYFLKTYSVLLTISLYSEMLILKNHKKFLKVLSILLSTYIILNFISVVVFPGGLPIPKTIQYYFLGYDNASVLMIVLGLFFIIFSSYYFNKRLTLFTIFIIFIAFITYYLEWAASCLICCFLLLIYILFVYKKQYFKKYLNFKVLLLVSILLFLVIVVFRFQNLFKWLIVDILHKNLSLTGRTYIWNRCFRQIKNHWLLGIGVWDPNVRIKAMGIYHAHSTFLNIILEGGIVALLAYLNIFRVVANRLKNDIKNNEFLCICLFAIFVYFIATTIDVISDSYLFYIILNLSYYANYISYQKQQEIKKKKILIISEGYLPVPDVIGGSVETLVTDYLEQNEKIYKEYIDVVSCQIPNNLKEKVKKYNYTDFIYSKNKKNNLYDVIGQFSQKYLNKYIGTYYLNNTIKQIDKLNRKYDIIICEDEILFPIILKKNYASKIVIHLHSNLLTSKNKFYNEIINSTNKIFTTSDFINKQVNCPEKCITIYNGIDFKFFKKPSKSLKSKYGIDKEFVFGYYSRKIINEIEISDLINAFCKLNIKYSNIKLLIIGNTNFSENANNDSDGELLNKNIIFAGYVDYKNINKYIDMVNVMVIPNDSFDNIAIESLAMDKRLIIPDLGALPEIVNKKYRTLIKQNDLYKAMEKEFLNKTINKNVLKEIKEFSKEEYANRIYNAIQSLK